MEGELLLPLHFWSVRYNGLLYPGAPGDRGLESGANCQRFAYEVLRHFGLNPPDFRSSELWDDTTFTEDVSTSYLPLDLLLWNRTSTAYGAHIGVYLGDGKAVHLSRRVSVPAAWPLAEFERYSDYRVFIGAKRVLPGRQVSYSLP